MKKMYLCILLLVVCSINNTAQISPYSRPAMSTYTPLSPSEIMMPAMIMRQRHDAMAKNINDITMYINGLKSQTTDAKFISAMDVFLSRLRSIYNSLETRGVNAVSESSITQIYNDVQAEINNYNRRITDPEGYRRAQEAEFQRIQSQRIEEERRIQALKDEEQARERALIARIESYNYYVELAYQALNKNKRGSFLSYSDKALSYGLYGGELYYDRGIVYRDLGEIRLAREELINAQKYGYPISNRRIKKILKH